MTVYPAALDALVNPTGSSTLDSPNHADQHANANDAIEALQAKVGIDGSADTNSLDYKVAQNTTKLSGVTGLDVAASLTGTETLTNKTLTTPKIVSGGYIQDENGNELVRFYGGASVVNNVVLQANNTGTGAMIYPEGDDTNINLELYPKASGSVRVNNDTIVTETATQTLTNKTIDKSNNTLTNPYMFKAYRSANYAATSGGVVQLNSEAFDLNSNFDTSTYTYTVPVTGYYQFDFKVTFTTTAGIGYYATLYVNGAQALRGSGFIHGYTNSSYWGGSAGGGLVYCTAGDTVNVYWIGTTNNIAGGEAYSFLSGHLVST